MNHPDNKAIFVFLQGIPFVQLCYSSPVLLASYMNREPSNQALTVLNLYMITQNSEALCGHTPKTASLVSISKPFHKSHPRLGTRAQNLTILSYEH